MAQKIDLDNPLNVMSVLSGRLDYRQRDYTNFTDYFNGDQYLSFIAPELKAQIGKRLDNLNINIPSLVCTSIAERLTPLGLTVPGDKRKTQSIDDAWQRNGLDGQMQAGILDALVYGHSYAIVWMDSRNKATVTIESALNMCASFDPVTGEMTAAIKRWVEDDGRAYGVVYTAKAITFVQSKQDYADVTDLYSEANKMTNFSHLSETGWEVTKTIPNPLSVVPVVILPNAPTLRNPEGVSELADIMSMVDGINKLATDMMVTSEFYAEPRRWATGIDIREDDESEDGLKTDLDTKPHGKWFMLEDPTAKIGQFQEATMDNYISSIDMLVKYIAAVKKIPAHYFDPAKSGLASAEAVRAAEAPLVTLANRRKVAFSNALETIGKLILLIEFSADVFNIETRWADSENLTAAQKVDAASKKAALKVPTKQLWKDAGYSPQEIEEMELEADNISLNDTEEESD